MKSKTYTQNKQPFDKFQSSKFCQLGVKRTRFQNLKKKRKWFFDHSTTLKIHKVRIQDKPSFVPQVIVKFLISFLVWKYQSHLISSRLKQKQVKLCYYLCFLPGTQLMDSPVDNLRQKDLSFHSEQIPPLLRPAHPLYGTPSLVSCKTQRIASDQPRQVICSTLMKDASLQ